MQTFSRHAKKAFPVRKMQSDIDLELSPGANDDEYLSVNHILCNIARKADKEEKLAASTAERLEKQVQRAKENSIQPNRSGV